MKILAADRLPDETLSEQTPFDIVTDSSVVMPGRPLFIPDIAPEFNAEILFGVSINRVGKNIAARFANRYYDSFAIFLRLFPVGDNININDARFKAFDSALTMGQKFNFNPDENISLNFISDNYPAASAVLTPDQLLINDSIALLSRFFTLKTGDFIIPCRSALPPLSPRIDTRISVSSQSETIFEVKLK